MTALTIDRDEVLKMAKQAGFAEGMIISTTGEVLVWDASPKQLEAFAKLVADVATAKEREACAKFFDDNDTLMFWGSQAATHIRSRGGQAT